MIKQTKTEWNQTGTGLVSRNSGVRVQILSLLAMSLVMLPGVSRAVDKTWLGLSANWSSSGNWSPTGMPTAVDTVIFDGTGNNFTNINLGGDRVLGAMAFTTGQTESVTISGSLTSYSITFTNVVNVLSVDAGNHKITSTGTTEFVTLTARTNNFNIASNSSFDIGGRTLDGGGSRPYYYFKKGGGTLILSANNGGTGGWLFNGGLFNVQQGVLRLTHSSATGNSGNNFVVSSGAAIELANNISPSSSGMWTLNGTGISSNGGLRSNSGNNSLAGTGTVMLASNASIGVDSGTLTIRRMISGSATRTLTKVGEGTLLLSTNNTYLGGTIVRAGTLSFGFNNALSVSNALNLVGGALVMGSYTNELSTLTLAGDSTINLGTGSLRFADSSAVSWTGALSLTGTLGAKTLRFGQNASGLSAAQKNMIKNDGKPIQLDKEGYVVIPRGTVLIIR